MAFLSDATANVDSARRQGPIRSLAGMCGGNALSREGPKNRCEFSTRIFSRPVIRSIGDAMSQHDDNQRDVLRVRSGRQDEAPDPADSAYVVDRLTVLAHELSNLLDGAMRCLGLARTSLGARAAASTGAEFDATRRQLETVYEAMERMASLVHGASQDSAGSILAGTTRAVSLCQAVRHAISVTMPTAAELGIEIAGDISPSIESISAGQIYPVLLNALGNAVDSIASCTGAGHGGRIEVSVALDDRGTSVILRVRDDGAGPPQESDRVFEFGFTTKPNGAGVGLAVSRDVVQEIGGTIELRRLDGGREPGRPGAELIVTYPLPGTPGDNWIG
jgi:signal transduction histidine kinase